MPNFKVLFSEATSSKILHTSFPAFKFPDRSNLHIQCTVVICNTTCPKFDCKKTPQFAHHLAKRYANSEMLTFSNVSDKLTDARFSQIGVSTFIAVNEQYAGYESNTGILDDLWGEQTLSCFTLPSIIIVFTLLSTSFFASLIVAVFMSSKACLLKKRLLVSKTQLQHCEEFDCFAYANAVDFHRQQ
ncbi:uncharacterized protein B4U80_05876 [Leptotrombidium deliense]|uniref:ZP domain-containing protein n=1 Tax=Leptotrombidium deliense TaxID=299467 RepID=A0A443ST82_9ACAR|nr:uncharacterized protein B4U80_05876 [Leptotrombidium deliense]